MSDNEPKWVTSPESLRTRMEKEHLRQLLKGRLTRRELLAYGGLAGMSLAALWALGCEKGVVEKPPKPGEAPQPPAAKVKIPTELRIRHLSDPPIYDPTFAGTEAELTGRQVWSSLLTFKFESFDLVGDLAAEWSRSPDGLVYTFKLRKDAKWHKGYGPVTAKDVKYTIERFQTTPKARWAATYKGVDKIETPDDYTVKITLKEPDNVLLYYLATHGSGSLVNEKAVKEFGVDYGNSPKTYMGSGAYVLTEWKSREYITFVANEEYYGGVGKIKKVTSRWIGEMTPAVMAMEAGELDYALFDDYMSIPAVQKGGKVKVYIWNLGGAMSVFLNTTRPLLDKLQVRQALAHATNKDNVVGVFGGVVERAKSQLGPNTFGYDKDLPEYPFDPKKAIELLKQVGLEKGFAIPFTTMISGNSGYSNSALVLANDWAKIGCTVNLEVLPSVPPTIEKVWSGNFDVANWELGYRAPHPYVRYWDRYHSKNFPAGKAPYSGIDTLLDEIRGTTDPKKELDLAFKIQRKAHYEDVFSVPLFYTLNAFAVQPYLKGFGCTGNLKDVPWQKLYFEG